MMNNLTKLFITEDITGGCFWIGFFQLMPFSNYLVNTDCWWLFAWFQQSDGDAGIEEKKLEQQPESSV